MFGQKKDPIPLRIVSEKKRSCLMGTIATKLVNIAQKWLKKAIREALKTMNAKKKVWKKP